jgi:hypothetical protein
MIIYIIIYCAMNFSVRKTDSWLWIGLKWGSLDIWPVGPK